MSVFDPYVGSGSSRIAAYEEGVNFYGAEIDEVHFNRQQKRFDNHTAQMKFNF